MKLKWFKDIENLEKLRKEYRRFVVQHHPDNGGNEAVIKEINSEYDMLFKKFKSEFEHKDTYKDTTDKQRQAYDWQKDVQIRNAVLQLSRFKGITVEIIGVWIWVSNCYEYRKELKELGFHYARQKQMWYKHFDDYHKFGTRSVPISYIRSKYGSTEIKFYDEQEEKERKRIKAL